MPLVDAEIRSRAQVHAALGEPIRLAIIEELAGSDRSPKELIEMFGVAPNLLAHHLGVLAEVGLIERIVSSGDRRRRYIRLRPAPLAALGVATAQRAGRVLFVCSHNSARSQLAAALWNARTGDPARSAGTHPADRVHPGAVAAARRAGLDLTDAVPTMLDRTDDTDLVVTVCDRAHEELDPDPAWLHWSTPDPVEIGSDVAFDATVRVLETRIRNLTHERHCQ